MLAVGEWSSRIRTMFAWALLIASVGTYFWLLPWWAWLSAPILSGLPLIHLAPGIWVRRGPRLGPPVQDLGRRRIAWRHLSELYLDTQLGPSELAHMASELAGLGYTPDELEQILYVELHGLLVGNLADIAGEWAMFDPEWMEREVLGAGGREAEILSRRPFNPKIRVVLGKWLVGRTWRNVRATVEVFQREEL